MPEQQSGSGNGSAVKAQLVVTVYATPKDGEAINPMQALRDLINDPVEFVRGLQGQADIQTKVHALAMTMDGSDKRVGATGILGGAAQVSSPSKWQFVDPEKSVPKR